MACSGSGNSTNNQNTGNEQTNNESDTDSNSETSPSNSSAWLSGGTAAMLAAFPPAVSPFASGLGNMCSLTGAHTLGPCFFDVEDERDDISEGQPGVPMTLAMKLVNANCNPVEGAVIEVWWCDAEGVYSGDNSEASGNVSNFNAAFCTSSDTQALNSRWFRGIKTTNSEGEVYFKACFPGWYPSRTTHIHFRIVLNGNEQLVSQFAFDDELANDIYLNHEDYTGSEKDTSNASDGVFSAETISEYLYEVEQQSDGSMLAYKAVQINV